MLSRLGLGDIYRVINSTIGTWWSPRLFSLFVVPNDGAVGIVIRQRGRSPLPLICVSSIRATRIQNALAAVGTFECLYRRIQKSENRGQSRVSLVYFGKLGRIARCSSSGDCSRRCDSPGVAPGLSGIEESTFPAVATCARIPVETHARALILGLDPKATGGCFYLPPPAELRVVMPGVDPGIPSG